MNASSVKPHLSPSQLEMYCKCPEQYRRRYMEGEIIPPGIAALQGKGFHGGAEANMRQKIESHRDLKATEIQELAAVSFDEAAKGGYCLSAEEELRGAKAVLADAKDTTIVMAGAHAVQQAPDYQPVLVEEKIRIELPSATHDLLGIIDLADDKDRVTDFKTSGKRKSQADADSSVQLTTYHAAFKARMGRDPSEVRLDTMVKTKRNLERDVVSSTRQPKDFQALANRINVVSQSIQLGIFPPTTPGVWWCSGKFCGYYPTCPYVNSERKEAAEKGSDQ